MTAGKGEGTPRVTSVSLHSTGTGQAAATHTVQLRRAMDAVGAGGELVARRPDERALLGITRVALRTFAALRRTDVLYLRAHPTAVVLVVAARLLKVPVVVEVNGTTQDLFDAHPWTRVVRPLVVWVDAVSLRLADGCVAVTRSLADWCDVATGGRTPTTVVPNGADLDRFTPDAAGRFQHKRRYVAFCGAFAPWQGIAVLLAAIGEEAWPDDVDLVLAGTGPEEERVRQAVRADDRVHHLGSIAHERVADVVASSLAVVSPNTRTANHGSPMKLYEAIACGVPVVASDVAGQAEIVSGFGVGLLYPHDSPSALADGVRHITDHEQDRIRWRASALAHRDDISWEARSADVLSFIARVTGAA